MKSIITKYLTDSISEKELLLLKKWLKKKKNKETFISYLKADSILNTTYNSLDSKKAYSNILKAIDLEAANRLTVRSLYYNWKKYAAILAVVLCLSYLYFDSVLNQTKLDLVIPKTAVTLTTSEGTIIDLSSKGEKTINNDDGKLLAIKKGNSILMQDDSANVELLYSEINIPYGNRFVLVLSDGTKVHLNSGSKLKFPNKFIDGLDRKVFLEGEAYFDVSKDRNKPFIVDVNEVGIRVLGTQFNVSSYFEDTNINTVLIEGSVAVYEKGINSKGASVIKPNQGAFWDKNKSIMTISNVNTDYYTAWREGRLRVRNMSFKHICKKIERQYNVQIINNNLKLAEQRYNMNFSDENIEEILNTLNESYAIKYKIIDNQIIIN